MQEFNFHTHTYRCGHAVGDEYDMADSAIKNGFKVLGFSEHVGFKDWDNDSERIPFLEMDNYFEDIQKIKEKYKDKIKIYTGLEFEYFDNMDEYYDELKKKCDYMIIGEHYIKKYGKDLFLECTDEDALKYAEQVCKAIEKGYTKYVAHPSYIMVSRDEFSESFAKAIEKIALCAKKNNAVIEWNLKGMARGIREYNGYESYIYPHLKSLEIVREINPMIVIGYDAHSPKSFENRHLEETARKILDGANIIDDFQILLYNK